MAAVVAGAMAAGAMAAPLDLKQVAGDAQWVGHVDFDAVRDSSIVKKAMEKHLARHKNAEGHMKMCEMLIGMNPQKDLHGMTMYGMKVGKHKGVAILHAKVDRAKVEAWVSKLPGRQMAEHGDYKISVFNKKHGDKEHTLAASWYGTEHLVMASSVDELKAALDVLDGKSSSVGDDSALAGPIAKGTTVMMRATGIKDCDCVKHCPIGSRTESFRFVVGENDGKSFFRSRSTMTNSEIVGDLGTVVEGVQAAVRIHCNGNEQGLRIANGLKVKADGNTLTLLWSASADDVWEQAEFHAKVIKEKIAEMKKHHRKHGGKCKGKCPKCDDKCPGDKCPSKDKDKDKKAEKSSEEDEI
jgi:hypothetical protein